MYRILITTESLNAGGAERQILELVKGLHRDSQYKISIATLTKNGYYDTTIKKYAEIFYPCNIASEWKYFKTLQKTYHYLLERNFDIVHSFSLNDSILMNMLKHKFKLKWINGTIRDTDMSMDRRQLQKLLLLKLSKYVVSNSYKGLEVYKIKSNDSKRIIYNGIDFERFNFKESSEDNTFPLTAFNIGVVANLSNYKDYYTIFTAMRELSNYPFSLHVIGDGPKMNEYKMYVHSIGIANKVFFYGRINNVEKVIRKFDCGLLCSYEKNGEGISNAVLEFMACSIPVIATRVGAIPEIIDNQINGLLIDAGDAHQLAQKITYLYCSPNARKVLGVNAKKTVREKFNYSKMIGEYKKYYNFLLND